MSAVSAAEVSAVVAAPDAAAARTAAVSDRAPPPTWQVVVALAAVYVIWGSTYLVMRWAVEELPPMLMGAIRFVIAGAVLYAIVRLRGGAAPTRKQWLASLAVGGLLFVGGNGFVAIAERTVSSGVAAVVCATMPLWLALMVTMTGERSTAREWLGMALGFAGVVVLVGDQFGTAAPVDVAVIVLAPLAWATGSMLSRRLPAAPGLMAPATQMLAGGVLMAVAGALRGESIAHVPSGEAIGSMVYLIVLGSLVGFTAYMWLLRNTRPAVATSYAFVNPPIAVVAGVLLGGETAGWPLLVATPLIVVSIVLVVLAKQRRTATDRA